MDDLDQMKMTDSLRNILFIFIILLASDIQITAFGQSDKLVRSDEEITGKKDTVTRIHSLYSGAGFGSNIVFLGSTISNDKPFYSAALTYGFKNAFYASASAAHIFGISPYVSFSNGTLSYNHVFNSWFDISSSIAGYLSPRSLHEELFNDFAFAGLTTGFDWRILYTKISYGEVFSNERNGYLQIRNSRYFETPEFLNGKGQISFDPYVNVLFGDRIRIVTITGTTKYGPSSPFHRFKRNTTTTVKTYHKFGLVDFEFSVPVTFIYNKFSLEAESSYILPAYTNSEYPSPKGFTFYINAYFRIF